MARTKILQKKIDKAIESGFKIHITTDGNWLRRNPGNRKDIKRIGHKLGIDYAGKHSVSNVFAYIIESVKKKRKHT